MATDEATPRTLIQGLIETSSVSKSTVPTPRTRSRQSISSNRLAAVKRNDKTRARSVSDLTPRGLIQGVLQNTEVEQPPPSKRPRHDSPERQRPRARSPATLPRSTTRRKVTRLVALATPGGGDPTPRSLIQGLIGTAPVETPAVHLRRSSSLNPADFPVVEEAIQGRANRDTLSPLVRAATANQSQPPASTLRKRQPISSEDFAARVRERISQKQDHEAGGRAIESGEGREEDEEDDKESRRASGEFQESISEDAGEESILKEAGKERLLEDAGEESVSEDAAEESMSGDAAEKSILKKAGKESILEDMGKESISEDAGEESISEDAGEESISEDAGEESISEDVGEESILEDVGEESFEPATEPQDEQQDNQKKRNDAEDKGDEATADAPEDIGGLQEESLEEQDADSAATFASRPNSTPSPSQATPHAVDRSTRKLANRQAADSTWTGRESGASIPSQRGGGSPGGTRRVPDSTVVDSPNEPVEEELSSVGEELDAQQTAAVGESRLSGFSPLVTPRLPPGGGRPTPALKRTPAHHQREEPSNVVRQQVPSKKKPPTAPRKETASLPTSLTKSILSHFSQAKVSKDALGAVEKGAEAFFKRLSNDLTAYSRHAHRQTIEQSDVELLMRRQGLIKDQQSMFALIEKYLPLEYRKELIPMATAGNKVTPKPSH